MDTETRELLTDLREQLKQLVESNSLTSEKVLSLAETIDQTINQESLTESEHHELKLQLKDSLMHFEVAHPKLTATMDNIISTLNAIGV
jgi:hypothetical protein